MWKAAGGVPHLCSFVTRANQSSKAQVIKISRGQLQHSVFGCDLMVCVKIAGCGFVMSMMMPFQSELEFQGMINKINAGRPQCPVGLNTLVLPSKGSLNLHEKHPYVYLACGHVHGKHEWGQGDSENRTCPLCMEVGQVVNCYPKTKGSITCLPEVMEIHALQIFYILFYHVLPVL